jgi:hypothetical protein
MPMIPKALVEMTLGDVETLCREGALEDEQIDFKRTVPHKDGDGQDPWRNVPEGGTRRVKDYGRDQLLAAVVAFANSYGGDLVVGIREQVDSQPGRAETLDPLPDCEELAHRLSQAANACIEPPLSSFQIRGVVTDASGSGVIVMRTGRSRNAPHRLTTTKDGYHRVRHETIPMSMRQIQDLTFNVARGLEQIERRLADQRSRYEEWVRRWAIPANHGQMAIHMAAVPLTDDVFLDSVHNRAAVRPEVRNGRVLMRHNNYAFSIVLPFTLHMFRPALRGSEAEQGNDEKSMLAGVYCDGTIRYDWCRTAPSENAHGRQYALHPGWYFATLVNVFESVEKFRIAASASHVEYALEIEVKCTQRLPVLRFGDDYHDPAGYFPVGRTAFPRYVIGARDKWNEIQLRIYRDFWSAIGIDADSDDIVLE